MTWSAVAGLGLLGGCKDDPSSETEAACATIGAAGGTVTSEDEVLSLAFRPGTFEERTEVCIRPAPEEGDFLAAWPAYRITPEVPPLLVTATITYRHPSVATQDVSIVKVRVEDYRLGQAQWIPLETAWVVRSTGVISTHDTELAMFYGLRVEGPLGTSGEGGDTTGTSGTTGDTSVSPTGGTTRDDIHGTDEGGDGTESVDEDGSTSDAVQPGSESSAGDPEDSDESGGPVAVDCAALPRPPFAVTTVDTPFLGPNNEGLAMVGDGTFVVMSGTNLVTYDESGTAVATLHSGISDQVLGLAVDPQGDPVFALGFSQAEPRTIDVVRGGTRSTYAAGFGLANGLHFAADGTLWVTDFGANAIARVTPDQEVESVLSGAGVQSPNGIFYDEDRGRLYWTNYGNAQLWSATIDAAGSAGTPERIAAADTGAQPSARWDGITMDACGHLYVVDQNQGMDCQVYRIELDAEGLAASETPLALTEDGALGRGCSSAAFGHGFGTEADRSLFVTSPADGRIRRVAVGVTGAPLP